MVSVSKYLKDVEDTSPHVSLFRYIQKYLPQPWQNRREVQIWKWLFMEPAQQNDRGGAQCACKSLDFHFSLFVINQFSFCSPDLDGSRSLPVVCTFNVAELLLNHWLTKCFGGDTISIELTNHSTLGHPKSIMPLISFFNVYFSEKAPNISVVR